MKFRFAFEKLMQHRKRLEDVARRNWLEAKNAVDQMNRKIEDMYGQIDDARDRAGKLSARGGAASAPLVQIDEFIRLQKILIERSRVELRDLLSEAERLQEILVEAARERKTLERLRERRLEAFRLQKKKYELKEMDELVVTRFRPMGDGSSS